MGSDVSHLGKVHLGEVLKERVHVASRFVGCDVNFPGRKVLLVPENQAADVPDEESCYNRFGLGVASGQHVGGLQDFLDRGDVSEVPLLHSSLQNWQEEVIVDLPLDQVPILLLLTGHG